MLASDDPDLVSHRVLTHRIGIVIPADHRLSQCKTVAFAELKDENWILFPRLANPALYDEIIACCHQAGFSPQIVDEVSPRQRAVALVACGAGITTMTEQRKHLCLEGTVFRLLRSPRPSIGCFFLREKRAVASTCTGISIPLYRSGEGRAYTGAEVQGGIANPPPPLSNQ
jgi:DNA-binding transcriptional LysR family regulator